MLTSQPRPGTSGGASLFGALGRIGSTPQPPPHENSKMNKKPRIRVLIVLLVAAVSLACGVFLFLLVSPPSNIFSKAAVAADAKTCSEIGRDILKKNGSAVDASIATLLCVSLLNAHSVGIGGGSNYVIYNASTGKVETINARETAPSNAVEDMFGDNDQLARKGALTIGIPGELRGYEMAHKRHGRLPWRELFQPSIALARKGFPIGKALALAITTHKEDIEGNAALCEVFCDSEKNILKENDIIRFPKLAETYQRIAEEGPDLFYEGSIAKAIVSEVQEAGGIITLEDLREYQPELNEKPLKAKVGQFTMYVPNAATGGPVVAFILNILNGYNFSDKSVSTTEQKILTYHRIVEAFRFGYAKRSELGDPRYMDMTELINNMTSDVYAEQIRSKIMDHTTFPEGYYGNMNSVPETHGTSHVSVVDEDGNAVAVTSTINLYFGSQVMSPSTGIILNSQMFDFNHPDGVQGFRKPHNLNNLIQPGKKPLSSMCPAIIFDKDHKLKMVIGAAGGTKIPTGIASVILNSLFFNYDLKRALAESRIHNQLDPNTTLVEPGFDQDVLEGLVQKNHYTKIRNTKTPHTVIQVVLRQDDHLVAESDPRKGGSPAGY
uniref:Glutathione hydrolase n=1 Tax=Cynoglossus semilaevis TaxID=244447 RepID=A0A3P8WL54_CYNSE